MAASDETRRDVVACVALSLALVCSWLLNAVAFPAFNAVAPLARDIATTVGALAAGVSAYLAMFKSRELAGTALFPVVALCCIAASACMVEGIWYGSAPAALVGSCARAIANVWAQACMGLALCTVAPRRLSAVIACAYVLKYVWMACLIPLPEPARYGAFCMLLGLAVALAAPVAREMRQNVRSAEAAADLAITNPLSFLPFTSRFFVAILLFDVALGLAITYGEIASRPQPVLMAGVAIATIALVVLLCSRLRPGAFRSDALYIAAFAIVLAGFLLVLGDHGGAASFSNVLLQAGSDAGGMATLLMVVLLARRNPSGALPVLCVYSAATCAGIELGACLGHAVNALAAVAPDAITLVMCAVVLAFVLFNLLLLRSFSFDRAIADVRPAEPLRGIGVGNAPAAKTTGAPIAAGIRAQAGLDAGTATDAAAGFSANAGILAGAARPTDAGILTGASSPARTASGAVAGFSADAAVPVGATLPTDAGVTDGARPSPEDACAVVARRFQLTPRESEVLALLARGRNAAHIQQALVLTRNTVKTHTANIYAKLDVHSQQELIDLVECECAGAR